MSTPLATRPSGPIAAAVLAIALMVACSASAARTPSATPSTPAATSAPTSAAATAAVPTASVAALAPAVTATAAPSPTAERLAQASPSAAPAASKPTAAPVATPTTAPASPASSSRPAAVAPAPTGPIAVTLLDSAIKLDRSSAPAGGVTFAITNAGTVIHQLVVLRTDTPQDRIPVDPTQPAKVSQPGFIAETTNMGPGTSLMWPLSLVAGKYVLMCNQPAHYLVGMHTAFTID